MTNVPRSIEHVAKFVGRVVGRLAALIIGFIMMVLGLAMTASVVMLPAGVAIGLLGVGVFVAGIVAPDVSRERMAGK